MWQHTFTILDNWFMHFDQRLVGYGNTMDSSDDKTSILVIKMTIHWYLYLVKWFDINWTAVHNLTHNIWEKNWTFNFVLGGVKSNLLGKFGMSA